MTAAVSATVLLIVAGCGSGASPDLHHAAVASPPSAQLNGEVLRRSPPSDPKAGCGAVYVGDQATRGEPTDAQQRAADDLVAQTRQAMAPLFPTLSDAKAAGFLELDSLHWYHPAWYADSNTLDPRHPEVLMYQGGELLGAMYVVHDRPGPQLGGPRTVWHTHCESHMPCEMPNHRLAAHRSDCGTGTRLHEWMLHVWIVPNAQGAFGVDMVAPTPTAPPSG